MVYYENYPPGVSSIPGDYDKTISYKIIFPYVYESNNDINNINNINNILNEVREYTGINDLLIDTDHIESNNDGTSTIYLIYEDDIETDVRYMDQHDIEQLIIKHTNSILKDGYIEPDDVFDLEYDIH